MLRISTPYPEFVDEAINIFLNYVEKSSEKQANVMTYVQGDGRQLHMCDTEHVKTCSYLQVLTTKMSGAK